MEGKGLTKLHVNSLPTLTWNFLKINDAKVEERIDLNGRCQSLIHNIPNGIIIGNAGCEGCSGCDNVNGFDIRSINGGMGREAGDFFDKACEDSLVIRAKKGVKVKEALCISYALKDTDSTAIKQVIVAEENSELTVVMDYSSGVSDGGFFGVQTKLYIGKGARINLVKIELLGRSFLHFDDIGAVCDDTGSLNTIQMELGGGKSYVGSNIFLKGYKSNYKGDTAYLCIEDQQLDMNYYIGHEGKKTSCDLTVKGALRDNAVKSFRGTIDLKKGAKGAKGQELEETLLLSEKVKNNTLPVILCDEDDVEGSHGASIGRLSGDILFYMQSRGLSEKDAEILMTKAKINSVRNLITDDKSIGKIQHYMEDAFSRL
ncbi:MAG: SufD family Fe-S cluster assembly protein [Lachnospiraceae bacterium]|nr:SufD family Fe-S cluster assembly protein [Lachnospiraceae bacterium]